MKAIKKDEEYKKYLNVVRACTTDLANIQEEVRSLHSSRKIRTMPSLSSGRIGKTSLQEQSYRSRLIELRMALYFEWANLDMAHRAIRDHIVYTYSDDIPGKTQVERDRSLRKILGKGDRRLQELNHTLAYLMMVVEDIDKGSYSLQRDSEALAGIVKGDRA